MVNSGSSLCPSKAFDCVSTFAKQLEDQTQSIMDNNPSVKTLADVNNVLKAALNRYSQSKAEAGDDLMSQCQAHLQFIDDVLYNEIDAILVTDPMYLWNRGKMAGRGHKFGIYQYSSIYLEPPYCLINATSPYDGNFTILPNLKKLANDFYIDINEQAKNIRTNDENSVDFLIKNWVNEHDLEAIVNPKPVMRSSSAPVSQQQTNTNRDSENHLDKDAKWALLFCLIGGLMLINCAKSLKGAYDNGELTVGELNPDQRVQLLGCISGLGLVALFGIELYGTSKPIIVTATERLARIMPSAATLNRFATRFDHIPPANNPRH